MSVAITLNGDGVLSCRLFHMWRGAWIAELELDPDDASVAPTSGPATLVLGTTTLTGTIDPRGSGSFVDKAAARVVGGAGGWDQVVPQQDFHDDAGVSSTLVYQKTASLIGETVKDLAPQRLGIDVIRSAGPASRVFGAGDWWVDLAGVTNVGARPSATLDASLVLADYDPLEQKVTFSCDVPLMPGTVLTDARFNNGASPVVRDVEQVFDRSGSKGTAMCSTSAASRLTSALANLIIELGTRSFLRAYRYRLIQYQGNRLALQAVNSAAGMPDIIPLAQWTGVAGAKPKLDLGHVVFVGFDHTFEPPSPIVLSYSPDLPLENTFDATAAVHLAPSAPSVDIAGGGHPIAWGDLVLAELVKIAAAITSLGGTYVAPISAALISSTKGAIG